MKLEAVCLVIFVLIVKVDDMEHMAQAERDLQVSLLESDAH